MKRISTILVLCLMLLSVFAGMNVMASQVAYDGPLDTTKEGDGRGSAFEEPEPDTGPIVGPLAPPKEPRTDAASYEWGGETNRFLYVNDSYANLSDIAASVSNTSRIEYVAGNNTCFIRCNLKLRTSVLNIDNETVLFDDYGFADEYSIQVYATTAVVNVSYSYIGRENSSFQDQGWGMFIGDYYGTTAYAINSTFANYTTFSGSGFATGIDLMTGVRVFNCDFISPDSGIRIWKKDDILMQGCYFEDPGDGFRVIHTHFAGGVDNLRIHDCRFYDPGDDTNSPWIYFAIEGTAANRYKYITNNTFLNGTTSLSTEPDGVYFANNTIYHTNTDFRTAVDSAPKANYIENNTFMNCTTLEFPMGYNDTFRYNKLLNCTSRDILKLEAGNYASIDHNMFYHNNYTGNPVECIELEGTDKHENFTISQNWGTMNRSSVYAMILLASYTTGEMQDGYIYNNSLYSDTDSAYRTNMQFYDGNGCSCCYNKIENQTMYWTGFGGTGVLDMYNCSIQYDWNQYNDLHTNAVNHDTLTGIWPDSASDTRYVNFSVGVKLNVYNYTGDGIPNADVWINDSWGGNVITGTSDANGNVNNWTILEWANYTGAGDLNFQPNYTLQVNSTSFNYSYEFGWENESWTYPDGYNATNTSMFYEDVPAEFNETEVADIPVRMNIAGYSEPISVSLTILNSRSYFPDWLNDLGYVSADYTKGAVDLLTGGLPNQGDELEIWVNWESGDGLDWNHGYQPWYGGAWKYASRLYAGFGSKSIVYAWIDDTTNAYRIADLPDLSIYNNAEFQGIAPELGRTIPQGGSAEIITKMWNDPNFQSTPLMYPDIDFSYTVNYAPRAIAANFTAVRGSVMALNASGTYDPNNASNTLNYTWTIRPGDYKCYGETVYFDATSEGTHHYTLVVRDTNLAWGYTNGTITVTGQPGFDGGGDGGDGIPPPTQPPLIVENQTAWYDVVAQNVGLILILIIFVIAAVLFMIRPLRPISYVLFLIGFALIIAVFLGVMPGVSILCIDLSKSSTIPMMLFGGG